MVYKLVKGLEEISGNLLAIRGFEGLKYGEIVEIDTVYGKKRGMVIEASKEVAIVQVFDDTIGIDENIQTIFKGETFKLGVSEDMLGRILDGMGRPIDKKGDVIPEEFLDVNGLPINPEKREYPEKPIETGISAIDGLNTLLRGQKLPIFSGSGLPHNELAAQIVKQSTIRDESEDFAVIFAAIGISHEDVFYFLKEFREFGILDRTTLFINTYKDPLIERILTPRVALTLAEYLAFELDYHVLVIMTDMTNYAEALREISASRKEIPGRRGYPGYLYTDLATIYERCGIIRGKKGSLTQMPILTMPNDDITHPIPDLTGYITEGQIVLSRELYQKGIYPPIDPFASLSRLMKDGIGEGKTRKDHKYVFAQLLTSYAEAVKLREIAKIIGREALGDLGKKYLDFGDAFEKKFLNQGKVRRTFEETLDIGWEVLSILPEEELTKIKEEIIKEFHPKYRK